MWVEDTLASYTLKKTLLPQLKRKQSLTPENLAKLCYNAWKFQAQKLEP